MKLRRATLFVITVLIVVASSIVKLNSASANGIGCGRAHRTLFDGSDSGSAVGVSGSCDDRKTGIPGPGGAQIVVVDCGMTGVNVPAALWDKRCGTPRVCPPVGNQTRPHPFASGFPGPDNGFVVIATWCPDGAAPTPSIASLRDEVIRLLPKLPVRMSPSRGVTLVNFRTLFWLDTPVERELGQSRLIGFPVTLRVQFSSARFDFGDGRSDTATAPGTRYDQAADCGKCEGRFGHQYQLPARLRVSVVVTWAAQFRIGGGAWLSIPGDVSGPVATAPLWVRQSSGVLVAPQ